MKISSVRFAIKEFKELQLEFKSLIDSLGMEALTVMVRQHYMDVDRGWSFYKIGLSEILEPGIDGQGEYSFWGKLEEARGDKFKKVMVIIDPETIDSIEFEVYEGKDDA